MKVQKCQRMQDGRLPTSTLFHAGDQLSKGLNSHENLELIRPNDVQRRLLALISHTIHGTIFVGWVQKELANLYLGRQWSQPSTQPRQGGVL